MPRIEITRSNAEIDRVLNKAYQAQDRGSNYPGMSYEQGITEFFDWLTGATDGEPLEDISEEEDE